MHEQNQIELNEIEKLNYLINQNQTQIDELTHQNESQSERV